MSWFGKMRWASSLMGNLDRLVVRAKHLGAPPRQQELIMQLKLLQLSQYEPDWVTLFNISHEREGRSLPGPYPLISTICRYEHFQADFYKYWSDRLQADRTLHRKLWEWVVIVQALHERGILAPGRRGLGFGVGREPLASLFAGQGCEIVATDAPQETGSIWETSGEHASELNDLHIPHLCEANAFKRLVTFRAVNMNAVPADLGEFDFCWSSCAFEHLGSLRQGMDFVKRSMDCLKPGGIAVHTTEFNLISNEDTLERGGTVAYRRKDLELLADELRKKGHTVAPFELSAGGHAMDRFVEFPPYIHDYPGLRVPHLKMVLDRHILTSVLLIVERGPG